MTDLKCDVAIIGAGTAGLAAERSARAAGASTLLIDEGFRGTTCASVGCIPSKLLIAAAQAAHGVRASAVFGIVVTEPRIDGRAVMARLRQERDGFVAGVLKSIREIPAGITQQARGRFTGATTLRLDDGRSVSARAVVIATGSQPDIPTMFEALGDRVLTNETIFELPDLPKSVAVIGAGSLGLELAQAMARLGVDTGVFDDGDGLAGLDDGAVVTALHTILAAELPIYLGVKVRAGRIGPAVNIRWSGRSTGAKTFDYVLVATGRRPRLDGLDLPMTGLDLDDHGTPKFDVATLQCGAAPIFIAGDADANRPVLHEAATEGAIAGRNAGRFPRIEPGERGPAFSIMFTDPPVAVIGTKPADDALIGTASYADQGRAKIEARNAGLVRLYAEASGGRLVGATMAGPGMDHIGHLIAWAVSRGETAASLLELPFYHPTFEEGLTAALQEICGKAGVPQPSDRDRGT